MAGREAKGYWRLSAERRAKIEEARRLNPRETQEEVGRATGVSRIKGCFCRNREENVAAELVKPGGVLRVNRAVSALRSGFPPNPCCS